MLDLWTDSFSSAAAHESHIRLFATPQTIACQAPYPWDSPGKNTGIDCRSLFQRIFLTQGSNPGLLHCRFFIIWASGKIRIENPYSIGSSTSSFGGNHLSSERLSHSIKDTQHLRGGLGIQSVLTQLPPPQKNLKIEKWFHFASEDGPFLFMTL